MGMATKMNGYHHNGVQNGQMLEENLKQTENEIFGISNYSTKLEKILLSLLQQQEDIRREVKNEIKERENREKEILAKLESDANNLAEALEREKKERKNENEKKKKKKKKKS